MEYAKRRAYKLMSLSDYRIHFTYTLIALLEKPMHIAEQGSGEKEISVRCPKRSESDLQDDGQCRNAQT